MFQVVTIALLVSWIAAVVFIPYLGDKMLPDLRPAAGRRSRFAGGALEWRPRAPGRSLPAFAGVLAPKATTATSTIRTRRAFYQRYRKLLDACLRHRWLVIGVTVLAFVLSIVLFRFVPQQFFPDSTRPELMVDLELAEGSSLRATEAQAEKLEKHAGQAHRTSTTTSPTSAPVRRASTCRWTSNCRRPTSPSSSSLPRTCHAREALRNWLIDDVEPAVPATAVRA